MAIVRDFRYFQFDQLRVDRCGKHIGRHIYWKLYTIENLVRTIIHSVLTAQINSKWWDVAVDPKIQKRAAGLRQQYAERPGHTLPGNHDIYYVFLSDLNKIIGANSNLFLPVLTDVDNWIVKLEGVRLPRNIVSHMNFPNQPDRQKIDKTYNDFVSLLPRIEAAGVTLLIP